MNLNKIVANMSANGKQFRQFGAKTLYVKGKDRATTMTFSPDKTKRLIKSEIKYNDGSKTTKKYGNFELKNDMLTRIIRIEQKDSKGRFAKERVSFKTLDNKGKEPFKIILFNLERFANNAIMEYKTIIENKKIIAKEVKGCTLSTKEADYRSPY